MKSFEDYANRKYWFDITSIHTKSSPNNLGWERMDRCAFRVCLLHAWYNIVFKIKLNYRYYLGLKLDHLKLRVWWLKKKGDYFISDSWPKMRMRLKRDLCKQWQCGFWGAGDDVNTEMPIDRIKLLPHDFIFT